MKESTDELEQIRQIRQIMERSSRFISLSGLSGVFAGFFALAGVLAFHIYLSKELSYGYSGYAQTIPVQISNDLKLFAIADGGIVIILSLLFAFYFTTRNAKRNGHKIWDATSRRLLINLAIPLIAGGVYCLVLLHYGFFGLIAPTTLIFYGIALLNASKFTLDEIRWLGLSETVLGVIACFFLGYGLTFWTIGFGVLHIIYGLMMYARYESKPKPDKF